MASQDGTCIHCILHCIAPQHFPMTNGGEVNCLHDQLLEGSSVLRGYIFGSLEYKKMGNIKITYHVLSAIIVKYVNPI